MSSRPWMRFVFLCYAAATASCGSMIATGGAPVPPDGGGGPAGSAGGGMAGGVGGSPMAPSDTGGASGTAGQADAGVPTPMASGGSGGATPQTGGAGASGGGAPASDGGAPQTGAAGGASGCSALLPIPPQGQVIQAEMPTIKLARGFNTVSQDSANDCLDPTSLVTIDDMTSPQRRVTFRMRLVQDYAELATSLGLSAAASFRQGLWGGSASAQYMDERQVSSYSTYFVVESTVEYRPQLLGKIALSTDALSRLQQSPGSFVNTCGDQYVSSVTKGSRLLGVISIFGMSQKSQQEFMAKAGASFEGEFEASASYRSSIKSFTSRYQTSVFATMEGGPTDVATPTTVDGLLALAQGWPAMITADNAFPIEVSTSSYYVASNFPLCAALPDYGPILDAVDQLGKAYDRARDRLNFVVRRLGIGGRLTEAACSTTRMALEAKAQRLRTYMSALKTAYGRCRTGQVSQCDTKVIDETQYDLPTVPTECRPFCGSGPDYKEDPNDSDDYGFCVRCRYQGDFMVQHNSSYAPMPCNSMRSGAKVAVHGIGNVSVVPDPNNGAGSWLAVGLDVQNADGDALTTCDWQGGSSTCRQEYSSSPSYDIHLSNGTTVESDGSVFAQLRAMRCTRLSDRSCLFRNFTVDICDVDSSYCN